VSSCFSLSTPTRPVFSMHPVSWHHYHFHPHIPNFPFPQFYTLYVLSAHCIQLLSLHLPCRTMLKLHQVSYFTARSHIMLLLIACIQDEIFQQRHRAREARPDSFAEEQARWARETIDKYLFTGENLVQVLQGGYTRLQWSQLFTYFISSKRDFVLVLLVSCQVRILLRERIDF